MPQGSDGRRPTARAKGKVEMHETLYHFHAPETELEANAWLLNFLLRYNHMCSGSTTVDVWLANSGRFGLTLCDNSLGGRLMLSANGLKLADNGSTTAQPAHAC
jgi:hypothetical protein